VIAIGYAEALQGAPSVTSGILSAIGRVEGSDGRTYLQHSASTNPGNSGGPLADLQGRVLGVNSYRLAGSQGLFFAIPADRVRPALPGLIAVLGPSVNAGAPPRPNLTGTAPGDPAAVVRAFYQAISARDYTTAYALLSHRLQTTLPDESVWAAQFAREQQALVSSSSVVLHTSETAAVLLTLDTTWTTTTGSTVARRYTGLWQLVRENGSWLLDTPSLHRST
jgi:S1-C subfamily serine protease